MATDPRPPLHGILAEFAREDAMVGALCAARAAGYRRLQAFAPYPVEEAARLLGVDRRLPALTLVAGGAGAVLGYAMQYWIAVVDYPLLVGGKPLHSWPSFVLVTFESLVLCAAVTTVVAMFALNGLPRLNHPLFAVPGFERVTRDRFYVLVAADDPGFDAGAVRALFAERHAVRVEEVRS